MPVFSRYTLMILDEDLNEMGDPIVCWTNIDLTMRFNEPGSGMFTTPAHEWIREQLVPGGRVRVIRDDQVIMSGPIEKWLHERSDDGENAGVGRLTVTFADDLSLIVARLVYPDPAQTPSTQTTDAWSYTGNAELALRELVNKNAGPGALTARQIPNLILGTLASVGSSITVNTLRMAALGDVAREIAEVGGGLGFYTDENGINIRFHVYDPEDKSDSVRFGFNFGNMRYIAYERVAPVYTTAVVGGQGEGTSRDLIERNNTTDETAWGRRETLLSRDGDETTSVLEDEGDLLLSGYASTNRMTCNVVDTPDMRFLEHYRLGDIVAVETARGEQVADLVRTVHIQVYPTAGEIVSVTVGDQGARYSSDWERRVLEIETRLGRVEKIVVPAVP